MNPHCSLTEGSVTRALPRSAVAEPVANAQAVDTHPPVTGNLRAWPLPDDLRQRLRQARRARSWSFRRAAKAVGTSAGYLADLESGRRCPRRRTAEALIDALDLDQETARQLRAAAAPERRHGR